MPDDPLGEALEAVDPSTKFHRIAREEGLDPSLADDYAKVTGGIESGNRHRTRSGGILRSPAGALGIGQVMPDKKGGTTRTIGGHTYDLTNEDDNLRAGMRYFAEGGDDPVARRIGYLSGHNSRAVASYKRSGRIPKGGDPYTGVSFNQYVAASGAGGQHRQRPAPNDPLTEAVGAESSDPLADAIAAETAASPPAPARRRITPKRAAPAAPLPTSNYPRVEDIFAQATRRPPQQQPAGGGPRSPFAGVTGGVGPVAGSATGNLGGAFKQQEERGVARVQGVQQQVHAEQVAGQQALATAPQSATARMYQPHLNESEEVTHRLTAQTDQETAARESAARFNELVSQFTPEDIASIKNAVDAERSMDSVSRGIDTGAQRIGSGLLYKLAALVELPNTAERYTGGVLATGHVPESGGVTQPAKTLANYFRRQAARGEVSLEQIEAEIPPDAAQTWADFITQSLGALPEIYAATQTLGATAGFAALGGLESAGRNEPLSAVAAQTAKGALLGKVFEGSQRFERTVGLNRLGTRLANVARSGVPIAVGTYGVEKAFGADDKSAAISALANTAFHVGGRIPGEVGPLRENLANRRTARGITAEGGEVISAPGERPKFRVSNEQLAAMQGQVAPVGQATTPPPPANPWKITESVTKRGTRFTALRRTESGTQRITMKTRAELDKALATIQVRETPPAPQQVPATAREVTPTESTPVPPTSVAETTTGESASTPPDILNEIVTDVRRRMASPNAGARMEHRKRNVATGKRGAFKKGKPAAQETTAELNGKQYVKSGDTWNLVSTEGRRIPVSEGIAAKLEARKGEAGFLNVTEINSALDELGGRDADRRRELMSRRPELFRYASTDEKARWLAGQIVGPARGNADPYLSGIDDVGDVDTRPQLPAETHNQARIGAEAGRFARGRFAEVYGRQQSRGEYTPAEEYARTLKAIRADEPGMSLEAAHDWIAANRPDLAGVQPIEAGAIDLTDREIDVGPKGSTKIGEYEIVPSLTSDKFIAKRRVGSVTQTSVFDTKEAAVRYAEGRTSSKKSGEEGFLNVGDIARAASEHTRRAAEEVERSHREFFGELGSLINPHRDTGLELEMIKAGTKPIAIYPATASDAPTPGELSSKRLYWRIDREATGQPMRVIGRSFKEVDAAIKQLKDILNTDGPLDHAAIGRLLGYSKQEVEAFQDRIVEKFAGESKGYPERKAAEEARSKSTLHPATEVTRTAALQYRDEYQTLHTHAARRLGLDKANDDIAGDYFTRLRRFVGRNNAAKLPLVERAETAYHAGKFSEATTLSEQSLSGTHDWASDLSAANMGARLREKGVAIPPERLSSWHDTMAEIRRRMDETGGLSGGGSSTYDVTKHPKGGKADHEKIAYWIEPAVDKLWVDANQRFSQGKLKIKDSASAMKDYVRKEFGALIDREFRDWHYLNRTAAMGIAVNRVEKLGGPDAPAAKAEKAPASLESQRSEWSKRVQQWKALEAMPVDELVALAQQKFPESYRTSPEAAVDRLYRQIIPKAKEKKADTWQEEVMTRLNAEETRLDALAAEALRAEPSPVAQVAALKGESPRATAPGEEPDYEERLPIRAKWEKLAEAGRAIDPELRDYTPEKMADWGAQARKLVDDYGIDAALEYYKKARSSKVRVMAGEVIGNHLQQAAVAAGDTTAGRKLWQQAIELNNDRVFSSTEEARTLKAHDIPYAKLDSPAAALDEALRLWRQATRNPKATVPTEIAKEVTVRATRAQKAAAKVKELEAVVAAEPELPARKVTVIKKSARAPEKGGPQILGMGLGGVQSRFEGTPEYRAAKFRKEQSAKAFRTMEKRVGKYWNKASHPDLERARIEANDARYDMAMLLRALEQRNQGYLRRAMNLERSLMVSAFPTASRNAQSQVLRSGVERVTDAFELTLRKAHGVESDLIGRDIWKNYTRQFERGRPFAEQVLKAHPDEFLRMYATYAGGIDVPMPNKFAKGIDRIFGSAEAFAYHANYFNRVQEFHIRSAEFLAELELHTKKETGMTVEQFVAKLGADKLPPKLIKLAVDKALEVTFAANPPIDTRFGKAMNALIEIGNHLPATMSPAAFPRFMFNNLKFLYQYNPIGGAIDIAVQAKRGGNVHRAVARQLIGTSMFALAYAIRNDPDLAGEKWYELKTPLGTMDTRPFGPFSTYLLMAEAGRRWYKGERAFTWQEWLGGLGASTAPGGVSLATAERLYNSYTAGDFESIGTLASKWGSDAVRAAFTPVRQIKDIIAQFDPEERITRDTSAAPVSGAFRESIPFASRDLPPAHRATSERPIQQDNPLGKFVFGYRKVNPKNFIESEADRLHFRPSEIRSYTGNATLDDAITRHMGPLVDTAAAKLQADPRYTSASDAVKFAAVRRQLIAARQGALAAAAREHPTEFIEYRTRAPYWKQQLLEERKAAATPTAQ